MNPVFKSSVLLSLVYTLFFFGCNQEDKMSGDDGVSNFDVSPNGETIIFSLIKDGKSSIYKANIDGSNIKLLAKNDSLSLYNARFSANGQNIIFIGAKPKSTASSSLWTVKASGEHLKKISNDSTLKIEAIFSTNDSVIYYTQANEYKTYSEFTSKAAHNFDIYSLNLTSFKVDKISKIKAYNLSDLTDVDQNRMLLTKSGGDDGIFFYDKKSEDIKKITVTNDTLRNSKYYSNPIMLNSENIIAASSYQLVNINLKTQKERLIFPSSGTHFRVIRYNNKINKLFFLKTDDVNYINSLNTDGTGLKRIKLSH